MSLEYRLRKKGIVYTFSTAYESESNGMAEKNNRMPLDNMRSLLHESKPEQGFWEERRFF